MWHNLFHASATEIHIVAYYIYTPQISTESHATYLDIHKSEIQQSTLPPAPQPITASPLTEINHHNNLLTTRETCLPPVHRGYRLDLGPGWVPALCCLFALRPGTAINTQPPIVQHGLPGSRCLQRASGCQLGC